MKKAPNGAFFFSGLYSPGIHGFGKIAILSPP